MKSIFYAAGHLSELLAPRWIGIFLGVPLLALVVFGWSILSYFKADYEDRTRLGIVLSGAVLAVSTFILLIVLFFLGGNATAL